MTCSLGFTGRDERKVFVGRHRAHAVLPTEEMTRIRNRHDDGNDAPVEITKRFPQEPYNMSGQRGFTATTAVCQPTKLANEKCPEYAPAVRTVSDSAAR
jgi:hypothetical protein